MALVGREIILGVTGGIAVYKAVEVLRELGRRGARVQVVMTEHAQRFVTPLTFQALSPYPVLTDLLDPAHEAAMPHIDLARRADLILIAPATANVIGKLAAGIADDALTTLVLAAHAPILIAPAMNVAMYDHPAVHENLKRLAGYGYQTVGPEEGTLACGDEGLGRLARIEVIIDAVEDLVSPHDLAGERILVTAGRTEEPLDPVRYLSNRSSGRMGYALARASKRRGAEVTLVSGPTALDPPAGVALVPVRTAREMRDAVARFLRDATVLIMAAAVADVRPAEEHAEKRPKEMLGPSLPLAPNPDILAEAGADKGERIHVGFAAETHDLVARAREKRERKRLDLVVANLVSLPDAGFDVETNRVTLIDAAGDVDELPLLRKEDVAERVLDRVAALRRGRA